MTQEKVQVLPCGYAVWSSFSRRSLYTRFALRTGRASRARSTYITLFTFSTSFSRFTLRTRRSVCTLGTGFS